MISKSQEETGVFLHLEEKTLEAEMQRLGKPGTGSCEEIVSPDPITPLRNQPAIVDCSV